MKLEVAMSQWGSYGVYTGAPVGVCHKYSDGCEIIQDISACQLQLLQHTSSLDVCCCSQYFVNMILIS